MWLEVCVGGGIKKGREWWNEEIKMKVEEKKKAYEEWLQCRSREKYEIYKEKNVEVKRRVAEAKRNASNNWGRKLGGAYEDNKKMFWKELKRARKGESRTEETVKDGKLEMEGC